MAGVTFSEVEVKRLILALAGSKASEDPKMDEEKESPEHEAKPGDAAEDKAEGEAPDSEGSAGKPFGKQESTKDMLVRKMREKGSR